MFALHGFSGSGSDYEALAGPLGHRMVAPSLAGLHGSMEVVAGTLSAVRRQTMPGPWVLLGYSMGARIALHLALSLPEPELVAVVLVGGTPGIRDPTTRARRLREDEALAARIEHSGIRAFSDSWERNPIIASQSKIPSRWRLPLQERRRQQDPVRLAASLRQLGTGRMVPLWNRLDGMTVPTLLLTGQDDLKFTGIAREMCAEIANCRHIVVPGAGHCAHLEQSTVCASEISAFLDDLKRIHGSDMPHPSD